jgi:hypothetical protein
MVVIGAVVALANSWMEGVAPMQLLLLGAVLGLGGLLFFVLGVTSVMLFNQPKFLVAPHLRHQVGLIIIWARWWRLRRLRRTGTRVSASG